MNVNSLSAFVLVFAVVLACVPFIGIAWVFGSSVLRNAQARRPVGRSAERERRRGTDTKRRPEKLLNIGANKIIAHDGNGNFLVRAQQADDIAGGPSCFLPYNIARVNGQRSLYIVYQGNARPDYKTTNWIPAKGNYRVMPYEPQYPSDALLSGDATWQYVQEIK